VYTQQVPEPHREEIPQVASQYIIPREEPAPTKVKKEHHTQL
jgi:hypothetical protein